MNEEKKELKAEVLENIEQTKKDDVKEEKKKDEFRKVEGKTAVVKKHHYSFFIIFFVLLLLTIGVFSTIFALINVNNNKILGGISIENIPVEGMTKDEASTLILKNFNDRAEKDIQLIINGETFLISPKQIEVKLDIEKGIQDAYGIGRSGNIFKNNFEILKTFTNETNIKLNYSYNEEILETMIKEFETKLPNAMVENSYYIDNNKLVIIRGVEGVKIDTEYAKEQIISHIENQESEPVEIRVEYRECPEIDIEKIYNEVKCEPQNASYKKEPFEIIPHKNGLDFDIEKAKTTLEKKQDEYKIDLIITEPEIKTNEIGEEAFPDLLSSFSTKYDETNTPRSKNLKLAMEKLNGTVVMPGEVFSYNKTLGERTAADGYQYANGFAGGKVVPMLAGGICQISSTLYDAVLYANLNIVERHNHMFQATYVDPGKDATVVYGSLDFKFENTRNYPIMIKTKCGGGLAEIWIFGIKEEVEYEIEIITEVLNYTPYKVVYQDDSSLAEGVERVSQYGLQGCKSTTYRIVKLNGQEVSKEVLSSDVYSPLDKIVKKGTVKKTTEVFQKIEENTQSEQKVEQPVEIPAEQSVEVPSEKPAETPVEKPTEIEQ